MYFYTQVEKEKGQCSKKSSNKISHSSASYIFFSFYQCVLLKDVCVISRALISMAKKHTIPFHFLVFQFLPSYHFLCFILPISDSLCFQNMHVSQRNVLPFSATGTYSVECYITNATLGKSEESVILISHRNRLENSGCNHLFSITPY